MGRNEGIRQATGEIIAVSDAGCILDKDWVKNILEPFSDSKIGVVAGYYGAKTDSIFQKCLVPYVLIMPDKINPKNFLPATRSMAFKKSIWEKIGGFPEEFSYNEDYVFAKRLKKIGAKIVFAKNAIVYWLPRKNLKEAFLMFHRFARGDAEARIFRPKVIFLFLRYLAGLVLLFSFFIFKSPLILNTLYLLLFLYFSWAVVKNYRYVRRWPAIFILPLLQLISDLAVLGGTTVGFLQLSRNKGMTAILVIYTLIMLSIISWGVPNQAHPFPYHMDEWHQLMAIKSVFKYGSPNIEGAAHGSMLQFILSGLYLLPFMALKIIDPFSIKSSISSLMMQERIFEVLRLNTLLFGILSIVVLRKIVADYFKSNPLPTIFFFVFSPIWLSLSNYYKYDIALVFWILLALLFILKFGRETTGRNFVFAGIVSAGAFATKISSVPLFLIYIFAFFWFTRQKKRNYLTLWLGIGSFLITFLLFGIPDLLFGRGNYYEFLYSNIILAPNSTVNFKLGMSPWSFMLLRELPILFGHALFSMGIICLLGWAFIVVRKSFKVGLSAFKNEIFLSIALLLFILSILPLKLYATGNRALVLLPFLAIIVGISIDRLHFYSRGIRRKLILLIIVLAASFQILESLIWVKIKLSNPPQVTASSQIINVLPKSTVIGIENPPIYQLLPDLIVKEFYFKEDNPDTKTVFNYEIVDDTVKKLPSALVISNDEIAIQYMKDSPKKRLVSRLKKEGYFVAARFEPDFRYYRFIGDDLNFYFSGLMASPATITIYSK